SMKRVTKISALLLGLLLSVGVYAQKANSLNLPCLTQVSGLTDQQKEQIVTLEKGHQEQMATFRTERRSTTDQTVKAEVYQKMQAAKSAHQKDVLALLNDDQKSQYLAIQHGGKKKFKNKKYGNGQGNSAKGQGMRQGRGKGGNQANCQGNRPGRNRGGIN
ncbi:MAG TPA: hypothetical protein VKA27_14325, partial [Sunxiuqinia sp.]|nr:hypothetical protein [Sunxiuqinia sp.]